MEKNKIRQDISALITKSEKKLNHAEVVYKLGFYEETISLSYYAMFHIAKAVLLSKEIVAKRHSSVVREFGLHLVKAEIVEKEYGQWLSQGRRAREISDYDPKIDIDKLEAEIKLDKAKKFVARMKKILG